MESIFEIIVPLVIAFAYFLNNILQKSKKNQEPPSIDQRDPGEGPPDFPPIQQRSRNQPEVRGAATVKRNQPPALNTEAARSQQQRMGGSSDRPPLGKPTDQSRPASPPTLSWEVSEDFYENAMRSKLEQIEATRAQAEGLRDPQPGVDSNKANTKPSTKRPQSVLSGSVRDTLADPKAARLAFIYGEVFGPPVSQKKSSSVPGLN